MTRARASKVALPARTVCLAVSLALGFAVLLGAGACSDDDAPSGGTHRVGTGDGGSGSNAARDAAQDADRPEGKPMIDAAALPDAAAAELGPVCSHPAVTETQPSPCGDPIAPSTCRFETHELRAAGARELRALDLDADGRLDLAALASAAGFGVVRLSGPKGAPDGCTQDLGLAPQPTDRLPPAHASAGDLDADGDLDLVRLGCATSDCERFDRLELYRNDGRGRLERAEDFVYDATSDTAREHVLRAPIAIDLDGDERSEVVIQAVDPEGSVTVLVLAYTDGGLQERVRQKADLRGSLPYALDVDGDGDLDIAFIAYDVRSPSSEPLRIDVALMQDGLIDRIASTTYLDLYLSTPRAVVADLDEDGRADLALHVGSTSSIELPKELIVLRPEPNARFDRAARLPFAGKELVYAGRDPSCTGHVLVGLGAASLDFIAVDPALELLPIGSVSVSESISELLAADFDGDGRNELAGSTADGFIVYQPSECTR